MEVLRPVSIFRARTYNRIIVIQSGDEGYLMNETQKKTFHRDSMPGTAQINGTGSFMCPVAQTRLDITQPWTEIERESD